MVTGRYGHSCPGDSPPSSHYQCISLKIVPSLNGNLMLALKMIKVTHWWHIYTLLIPELPEDAYAICLIHLRNTQPQPCIQ